MIIAPFPVRSYKFLNRESLEKIPTQTENMTDWELVRQHDRLFVKIQVNVSDGIYVPVQTCNWHCH